MKILQVTAALDQGGVERGTVEMAAFIVQQGAQSVVASHGGRLVETLQQQGSEHLTLPLSYRNPLSILWCACCLTRLLRREGFDLVHARSRAPAWAAWLACRLTGTPFITTFHGTHRIQNALKRCYNRVMTKGERVIAISRFIKEHIQANYDTPDAMIDVAARGFDPDAFNPSELDDAQRKQLKQSIGLTEGLPLITLPGRLTRWKGQSLFLEALAQITDLKWQAMLVGGCGKKQSYLQELQERARSLQIDDRVHFVGDRDPIAPFLAISDVVVSASLEPEAFGRVAVEAQAMSAPVIAPAHGGALETVQDGVTGWLFAPGSAEALARQLRQSLSSDMDLQTVGARGRQWVLQHFTTDKMCQSEWESYQKVLSSSSVR